MGSHFVSLLFALLLPGFCHGSNAVIDLNFKPSANNTVFAGVLQPDGKILIGGTFTAIGEHSRRGIARLHDDGSVDPTFNPGVTNSVRALALQPDGAIVVGGTFTGIASHSRTNIARLNPDGTLDTSFNVSASGTVRSLLVQPDGKILVAGEFLTLNGHPQERIGRLNPDGTVDTNFVGSADGTVIALSIQNDGKILVGGTFQVLSGTGCTNIGRLEPDGARDASFEASTSASVQAVASLTSGAVLIGGAFSQVNGTSRANLARLHSDGSLDLDFVPGVNTVSSIVVQADGNVITTGPNLTRVTSAGVIDSTLNIPTTTGSIVASLPDRHGRLVVIGAFPNLGGMPCNRIARVRHGIAPQENWTSDGSELTWLRGGNHPEFLRTEFHHSVNGIDWTLLGAGERISGGWKLSGAVPQTGALRARGFLANANYYHDAHTPPTMLYSPRSVTTVPGSNATFAAAVSGLNLTYQWLRDGVPIPDANAAVLTLTNVSHEHIGGYQIVAGNSEGSVTSAPPVQLDVPLYVYTAPGMPGVTGTNDGPGMDARLNSSWDVTFDSEGYAYVVDRGSSLLRKISPGGYVSTYVRLRGVCTGVAIGPDGILYVVNLSDRGVDRINPDLTITQVAPLDSVPTGIVVDPATNIFVAMWGDHSIRKITPDGTVTVFAGQPGVIGQIDGVPGTFRNPEHLDMDAHGNLFVADAGNNAIRKITPNGVVSTYGGIWHTPGASNGYVFAATFRAPKGIAVDRFGNLIIAESGNSIIRKISPEGIVTTIAGAPQVAGTADGQGSAARFDRPSGLGVDSAGNICVADSFNHTIRLAVPNLNQPIITLHPQPTKVAVGADAVFTVTALNGPHTYQWFADGNPVAGANASSLTLTNVQWGADAVYHVAITNAQGWAKSVEAPLTVVRQPHFFFGMNSGYTPDGFGLSIAGLSGHGPVVLYASTNLIEWDAILTNPPVIGILDLIDPAATNWPFRFYRIEEE